MNVTCMVGFSSLAHTNDLEVSESQELQYVLVTRNPTQILTGPVVLNCNFNLNPSICWCHTFVVYLNLGTRVTGDK